MYKSTKCCEATASDHWMNAGAFDPAWFERLCREKTDEYIKVKGKGLAKYMLFNTCFMAFSGGKAGSDAPFFFRNVSAGYDCDPRV